MNSRVTWLTHTERELGSHGSQDPTVLQDYGWWIWVFESNALPSRCMKNDLVSGNSETRE